MVAKFYGLAAYKKPLPVGGEGVRVKGEEYIFIVINLFICKIFSLNLIFNFCPMAQR
ncbi:hypothetical protein C8R30_101144 [Nitrosomonas nitrosa]|nr:hypothetical protein C8R30_101144 [Nitrosomonas nitrosa]